MTLSLFARIRDLLAFLILFLPGAWAWAERLDSPLEPIVVQLNWKHQFEFAAFYAALEQGYYRQFGLDVTIREGGPGVDVIKEVTEGRAQFGVGTSSLVVDHARGAPVVALAALMQHSATGLLAMPARGIRSVHDLAGKPIAVDPHTRDEIKAYLLASGIPESRIQLVAQTDWTLDSLERGLVAAKTLYVSNEPFWFKGREHEFLMLTPRSAGIDLFGNILFTSRALAKNQPQWVKAFRDATLRGLAYALSQPDSLTELILHRYNSQAKSREHLLYEAGALWELTRPDLVEPGYMSPGRWQHVIEVYARQGQIAQGYQPKDFIFDPQAPKTPLWLLAVLAVLAVLLVVAIAVMFKFRHLNQALQREISEHAQAEDTIRNLAFYDPLTLLPNRRLLIDRLHQALALSSRKMRHGALLFIDLDNFKLLNDTHGHDLGDQLLVEVARRLQGCVREGDSVARLGGDEFVVMLEDLDETATEAANQAEMVAEKIIDRLARPYLLGTLEHHSTASLGITLFRDKSDGLDDLLKRADMAMYQAKASGRNTLRFFDPTMQASVQARAQLEAELRQAIKRNEFICHYQPQVDRQGRVVGAEALARWQHPVRGLILPGTFISLAEETGLIIPIGQLLLRQTCEQLAAWARHPDTAHLTVSFNVSARQFHHPDFVPMVEAVVTATGIQASRLILEITESLLLEKIEDSIARMHALKQRGVRFSIDDFGTGYSSLAYLKRLPLDELKIDRSFVADIESDENDAAICAAFVSLAHILGLRVVAEGVETEEQRYFLATVHPCDLLQGYLFGRPCPASELLLVSEAVQKS